MDERYEKILKETPTVAELSEYICIGDNWYQLGTQLNIDHRRLNDIHKLPENCTYKTTKMFELWLGTNFDATRRQVLDALRKEAVKEIAVADKYEDALKKSCIFSGELKYQKV